MYRYLAVDTVTGNILGDLELTGVTWERGLMATGGVQADMPLTDIVDHPEHAYALKDWTTPYRTGVVVLLDGEVVCDAIWQPRTINDEGVTPALTGGRTWSLFAYRYTDLDAPKVFEQTDQADIVRWLLEHGTDRPGGGMNLRIICPPTGVLRDFTVEDGEPIAELVDSLAEGAFDYDLTCRLDGRGVVREFRLFYPTQGGLNPDLVFRAAGNLTPSWTINESPVETVTTVVGESSSSTYIRDDMLAVGWPRIERRIVARDLTESTDVDALAQARSVLFGDLKSSPSVTVSGYSGWQPGEVAAVQFDPHPFHPEGYATWARIATTRVAVNDEGSDVATVRFADRLAALPPQTEAAAVGRELADVNRRLRNIE